MSKTKMLMYLALVIAFISGYALFVSFSPAQNPQTENGTLTMQIFTAVTLFAAIFIIIQLYRKKKKGK